MRHQVLGILMFLCMSSVAQANPSPAEKAFTKLKTLEGRWLLKGSKDKKGKANGELEYTIGSNGSTVVEKFEDMLTVYYLDRDTLMATHFCSVGNQPRFVADQISETANKIRFVFKDITNATDAGFMAGLTFDIKSTDAFDALWVWHDKEGDAVEELSFERDPRDYRIELVKIDAQAALGVSGTASLATLGEKLGAAFGEVAQIIAAAGSKPVGAPFARYLKFSEEAIEFEAGFPIARGSVQGNAGVKNIDLPAGDVAITQHVGSQETSGNAYKALHAWIAKNGYEEAGAPWEIYPDDPAQVPEEKQRTVIYYPVKKKEAKKVETHTHKHKH